MKSLHKFCLAAAMLLAQPALSAPLAEGHDKVLGGIFATSQIENFTDYFNQVTPENAGKWGAVTNHSSKPANMYPDSWFDSGWHGGLDNAFNLAKDNGFPFRMHVLVWGNQQPQWIRNLPANEQLDAIHEWFDVLAARYNDDRGGFDYIEVVNEPVNDPPDQPDSDNQGGNYIEALGGTGETGWDWVITAFEMARTYFPNSKLMVNEYNVVSSTNVLNNYVELIGLLHDRGLIDAIGVQGHAFSTRGTADAMRSHLDQLAAFNLPIYVTEMDVDAEGVNGLQTQLLDMERIFPTFWEHPSVQGVTFWGFRPGMWRTPQNAMLVEADGTERPAMHWLRCYLQCDSVQVIAGQEWTVNDGRQPGQSLGRIVAHSPNGNITSWQVVGASTDASLFTISNTGMLSLASNACLDHEVASSHAIEVVAHDSEGASEPETVTLLVTEGSASCAVGNGTPEPPPGGGIDIPEASSSGGAFGGQFLLLMLLILGGGLLRSRQRG